MPFGLCNAPGTFQRCMTSIFSDMVEGAIEVFMDDFSVVGDSFDDCLANLVSVLTISSRNRGGSKVDRTNGPYGAECSHASCIDVNYRAWWEATHLGTF